ncbi:hypothetical protein PQG22_11570 [Aquirufa beregesia]
MITPPNGVDATMKCSEKRNWVSPKIEVWEYINMGLLYGED